MTVRYIALRKSQTRILQPWERKGYCMHNKYNELELELFMNELPLQHALSENGQIDLCQISHNYNY